MKYKTKVSIIVPIYNVSRFLKQCLDSLLVQTLQEIEIILVDDGSTDESGEICEAYALKDSRIRVIHQKNMGLSGARNTGITTANSPWITIVDGDDWLEPDAVEYLYLEASKNSSDICIASFYSNYPDKQIEDRFLNIDDYELTFGPEERYLLQANCLCFVQIGNKRASTNLGVTWARIYRKDFLVRNNLKFKLGLKRMQDAVFHLEAFELIHSVHFTNKPVYHYRVWNESASKKYSKDFDQTALDIIYEMKEILIKYDIYERFLTVYNTKCIKLLLDIIKLKYVPKTNQEPIRKKIRDIKSIIKQEPYRKALYQADKRMMTFNQALAYSLLKAHMVFPVYALYRIKN